MTAIEFVKKHGWKDAKICLLNCASPEDKWFMRRGDLISGQDFADLKQIVDAFELMESFKCKRYSGISNAKDHMLTLAHMGECEKLNKLRQAIHLVEQCQ